MVVFPLLEPLYHSSVLHFVFSHVAFFCRTGEILDASLIKIFHILLLKIYIRILKGLIDFQYIVHFYISKIYFYFNFTQSFCFVLHISYIFSVSVLRFCVIFFLDSTYTFDVKVIDPQIHLL